jgi:uncharacterized membrane protein YkvA (DUF1232 family)
MNELNETCLETFPKWLRSLSEDIEALLAVAGSEGVDDGVKRQLIAGINYLFKSLDLIPDGIDDIGYLDDAFVLRISCDLAAKKNLGAAGDDQVSAIKALAGETSLIKEFLGAENYRRLESYTIGLLEGSARGRTVDEIATKEEVWNEFSSEVKAFSKSYEVPSFSREERNLIKLRAFFDAKLPK